MPFEHNNDEIATYIPEFVPLPFMADCEECAIEAWERQTYGGITIGPTIAVGASILIPGRYSYVAR